MSQITIGGTTLNFKDSAFTGDQWEQVASWVLNGGAEGIDANAQIATEKAAAASASAAAARNSATSAGESATAAANSATAAKASEDSAAFSAANAAASATSAGNSADAASERAANAANSASAAATSAQTAQSAASAATDEASTASTAAESASGSASQAQESAAAAAESAASVDGINKTAQSWAVGGTGTREGEDTNNAKYWAEQAKEVAGGDFATKADLAAKPSLVISEIPKGRMRGDIKGTGKVGTYEDLMASQYYNSTTDPANPGSWACDINGNGTINTADVKTLLSGSIYSHPFMADYYNNWTYHKVNDTSGYWTTELSIPAITAETEGSITWGGTGFTGTFIKAEAFSGGVRIYANRPPIEALPCAVSYHTGTGGQFIIANTGVSETGAKYVAVSLTASGWSGEKKQTISIPGLKGDAMQQLVIPTQPSTDIEKYHSAGIRISARGDNTLTFSCDTIPTEDVKVVLVIIPIIGKFEG